MQRTTFLQHSTSKLDGTVPYLWNLSPLEHKPLCFIPLFTDGTDYSVVFQDLVEPPEKFRSFLANQNVRPRFALQLICFLFLQQSTSVLTDRGNHFPSALGGQHMAIPPRLCLTVPECVVCRRFSRFSCSIFRTPDLALSIGALAYVLERAIKEPLTIFALLLLSFSGSFSLAQSTVPLLKLHKSSCKPALVNALAGLIRFRSRFFCFLISYISNCPLFFLLLGFSVFEALFQICFCHRSLLSPWRLPFDIPVEVVSISSGWIWQFLGPILCMLRLEGILTFFLFHDIQKLLIGCLILEGNITVACHLSEVF